MAKHTHNFKKKGKDEYHCRDCGKFYNSKTFQWLTKSLTLCRECYKKTGDKPIGIEA